MAEGGCKGCYSRLLYEALGGFPATGTQQQPLLHTVPTCTAVSAMSPIDAAARCMYVLLQNIYDTAHMASASAGSSAILRARDVSNNLASTFSI